MSRIYLTLCLVCIAGSGCAGWGSENVHEQRWRNARPDHESELLPAAERLRLEPQNQERAGGGVI